MVEVWVFAEGQSEEQFIKRVIAPALRPSQIFVKPQLLSTSSGHSGGAVSFDRLKHNARNTLRQYPSAVLTTFIDLYGLDTSFPNFEEAKRLPTLDARLAELNSTLHSAIVAYAGCQPGKFIPHIQPYEFEGLLFSDTKTLAQVEPGWVGSEPALSAVRDAFLSPEHINDSIETKPSKRLESLLHPAYKKTRHGPLAAENISLARMESECVHFKAWIEKLRGLEL